MVRSVLLLRHTIEGEINSAIGEHRLRLGNAVSDARHESMMGRTARAKKVAGEIRVDSVAEVAGCEVMGRNLQA